MPSPSRSPVDKSSETSSLTITSNDVVQGCFLWLADETETLRSYKLHGGNAGSPVVNAKTQVPANAGMFGHPIVVVSRPASNPNTIFFHQITSLAGRTLAERFSGRKAAYRQQTFCPVDPAPPHPQFASNKRYRTLTLENGDVLEKASFVNVREVYQMDWRDAQLYWAADPTTRKPWRLDTASVASLTRLTSVTAKFKIEPQYKARELPASRCNDHKSEEVLPMMSTTPTRTPNKLALIKPTPVQPPVDFVVLEAPQAPVSPTVCEEKDTLLPRYYNDAFRAQKHQRAATWLGALLSWIWPPQLWAFLRLLLCRQAGM